MEKFQQRLENLKINGEKTDFLYMGAIESALHNAWSKDEKGCKSIERLFEMDKSARMNPCIQCEEFDYCEEKVPDCHGGFLVEPDIVQEVVYYNYKYNSAIVFSIYTDSDDGDYTCETVVDFINQIYTGFDSPFEYLTEKESSDFIKAIYENDNVVYVHYSRGNVANDIYDINLHIASLKDIDVKNIMDILKVID